MGLSTRVETIVLSNRIFSLIGIPSLQFPVCQCDPPDSERQLVTGRPEGAQENPSSSAQGVCEGESTAANGRVIDSWPEHKSPRCGPPTLESPAIAGITSEFKARRHCRPDSTGRKTNSS